MVMNTRIRIAELKARLSECLRAVRKGHRFTVTDRETPVADLVPHREDRSPLVVRGPLGKFASPAGVPLPPAVRLDIDVVDVLMDDRQPHR